MSTRVFSLLLAAWMLCIGFTVSAQPLVIAPAGSVQGLLDAAVDAPNGATDDEAPFDAGKLTDRESLVDPPELFEALRFVADARNDAAAPRCALLAAPPPPFIEGLRRPPRGACLAA